MLAAQAKSRHSQPIRVGLGLCWALGGCLLLACSGKAVQSPDGSGGSAASSSGGSFAAASGGTAGKAAEPSCPNCPMAPAVQPCCEEVCGYLNTDSGECVPSIAGSQTFSVVTAPAGELCRTRALCESSEGCPTPMPAEGSACREDLRCSYCALPAIPRAMRCVGGAWVTIGPNPPCAYYVEP